MCVKFTLEDLNPDPYPPTPIQQVLILIEYDYRAKSAR